MANSVCHILRQYQPSTFEAEKLYSMYIICAVINALSSYTTIILNSITIHAMRKPSPLAMSLKSLLMSLAVSDLGVGLVVQTFAIQLLVKWLQQDNPTCTTYTTFTVILTFFSFASFFNVTALSADRFLAIHLHLRYQELVTYHRIVFVTILIWVVSAFLSLIMLWIPTTVMYLGFSIIEVFCLVSTTFFNYKIFMAVRRLANQVQSLRVQVTEDGANATNAAHATLRKSALGTFYVYLLFLICYLPNICGYILITVFGPGTAIKGFSVYTLTLVFVNSSLNPLIYCWKIRHIRHSIMDTLRNILTKICRCQSTK